MVAFTVRGSLLCVLMCFVFCTAYGSSTYAQEDSVAVDDSQQVSEFAMRMKDDIVSIIDSDATKEEKTEKLTKLFVTLVDLDWMARSAVGRYWHAIPDDQLKHDYVKAYKQYMIRTYVPLFKSYNNQSVKLLSTKPMGKNGYMLNMQIVSPSDGQTISVAYRCKKRGESVRIIDIIIENMSLIKTQRTEMQPLLKDGNISAVIGKMSK